MLLEILSQSIQQTGVPIFLGSAVIGAVIGWGFKRFNLMYIAMHQVDKTSKRNGGEIVAQVLHAHNIKNMFTLAGGHISPILAAAEKIGIKVVDTRHEVSAVFAADAVARMTGTVGTVAVTAGPGLTNTVTAIKNAQMAESPILLLGGAAATILKGRGALQDIDQMSLFKPICKYCATVTSVRDIAPILRRALQIAQSDTPGPVFVEMPIDVLYAYDLVKREVGAKSEGGGLVKNIVNWYLNNYVDNIFAGAWEPVDVQPLPVNIPMPSNQQIAKCIELLSKAKRPLMLMGSQSTLPPVKSDQLVRAINRLGIPCYLGGMSRGLLGSKSPLQARQHRRDALKEADLIILAGSVCDFRLSYGRVLPRKAPIIAINRNKDQLYKNSDMFWKPAVAVQADVASFLVELSASADGLKWDPDWVSTLQKRDKDKEIATEKMATEETETHLNPLAVLHGLEKVLPENAILVADGGDFVGSAAYILKPRSPLSWLDPGAFGTLGVGGGFALGAKLARPDSEVWIVWGDGSCGYSVAEFDTFTRFKLPVMALVGNDAGWTQILREQVTILGTEVAHFHRRRNKKFSTPDFASGTTMISSRCKWTLFISVALLLVIACHGQGSEESTIEDQEDQFLEHENATARKSSLPRHLCRNFVGCTCDGKHEKAECSCAISSAKKLHRLQIDTEPIPSTVKEIHISDCPALNISHPGILADCKFKKLYISNVDHLRIDGLILKHVDHLSIQQVDKLELDHDAFQCLEADTVRFQGVTFAPGSTLDINSVQSLLEIDYCNLTDAKILLVNSSQTDRTVSITNSHLDRFSAKIRAADFIMNENTFVRLPSGDRMVSVEYSRSLELKRNKYGIMDSYMPDVQLSNTTRSFHIDSKKGLSSDSLRWLEHLEGIGMTGHSRLGACEKRNPRDTLTHFNVYKSIKDVALVLQSKEKKGVVVGNNTSHLGTGTNTNEEGHAKLRNNVTSTHSFTSTILSFITSALIILILTF